MKGNELSRLFSFPLLQNRIPYSVFLRLYLVATYESLAKAACLRIVSNRYLIRRFRRVFMRFFGIHGMLSDRRWYFGFC